MFCLAHIQACHLFFFNDTATTEIYTLSLHDALPICLICLIGRCPLGQHRADTEVGRRADQRQQPDAHQIPGRQDPPGDRKSTRLNSSHANISYAVFCLKKNMTRMSSIHSKSSDEIAR